MFDNYGYEDEEWRDIPNYPNYMISNFGRVCNIKYNRFIKPFIKFGYEHVSLYIDGRSRDIKVHRLVGDAFLLKNLYEIEINHDDGDKSYNYVENLEWCTKSGNLLHAFRTGLKNQVNKRAVRIIETGEVFESLTSCAKAINGYPSAIRNCLIGKLKHHCGYTFEYAN